MTDSRLSPGRRPHVGALDDTRRGAARPRARAIARPQPRLRLVATLLAAGVAAAWLSVSGPAGATPARDAAAGAGADAATGSAAAQHWDFEVRLDGKPIGTHRYTVDGSADERTVTSVARFDVRLLGLSVYRYALDANERWSGDCLRGLDAATDDGGERRRVQAQAAGDALKITGGEAPAEASGCVMSYAYWNPAALARQTRLLNPQTGVLDPVTIEPAGSGRVDVGGRTVEAKRLRIVAPAGPLEIWTAPDGRWIGLDAKVSGGRMLSYRLPAGRGDGGHAGPAAPKADGATRTGDAGRS